MLFAQPQPGENHRPIPSRKKLHILMFHCQLADYLSCGVVPGTPQPVQLSVLCSSCLKGSTSIFASTHSSSVVLPSPARARRRGLVENTVHSWGGSPWEAACVPRPIPGPAARAGSLDNTVTRRPGFLWRWVIPQEAFLPGFQQRIQCRWVSRPHPQAAFLAELEGDPQAGVWSTEG